MLKSRFKSFKQIFYFKWGKILDTFYILLPFKIKASQRSEKFIIFLSYLILIKNRAEYLHNMIKKCEFFLSEQPQLAIQWFISNQI